MLRIVALLSLALRGVEACSFYRRVTCDEAGCACADKCMNTWIVWPICPRWAVVQNGGLVAGSCAEVGLRHPLLPPLCSHRQTDCQPQRHTTCSHRPTLSGHSSPTASSHSGTVR